MAVNALNRAIVNERDHRHNERRKQKSGQDPPAGDRLPPTLALTVHHCADPPSKPPAPLDPELVAISPSQPCRQTGSHQCAQRYETRGRHRQLRSLAQRFSIRLICAQEFIKDSGHCFSPVSLYRDSTRLRINFTKTLQRLDT